MLFDMYRDTIPGRFYYQELLGGANQQVFSSQTSSGPETPGQTELSRKTTTSTHQSRRTRWSEGEVKILITVYRQEYERKDRGRSQDAMWEKIAERVNSESTEMNSFAGKKDAKQCRDKIGEQGWCSGSSARLPPMCPGFDSRARRHMWAEFVGSLLCSERFFSGNSGFPLSSKTNI